MKKYVQTPTNLYYTFCKSVGHDEKDCRAYDIFHGRLRDTYRIQREVQQEGNNKYFNSQGRGNFKPHGGFRGRGRGRGMGQGQCQIIFYNCTQLGHLARDCQNPFTTSSYCNSFEHVIEYCPMLLTKLQERRGGNPQVQLISAKPRKEDPRVIVITRGGIATGEYRMTPIKTTDESGVRRTTEKIPEFDPRREKKTFEEARKKFKGDQIYSSKEQPEVRECGMPLGFNQSTSPGEGKEVRKLVIFLYMFIDLIKDEISIKELQHLIR
jgi:hypothetical protein